MSVYIKMEINETFRGAHPVRSEHSACSPHPEFHDKVKRNTLKWQEQQNPSDSLYWFKMVSSMEITFSNLKYSAKCFCLSHELVLREGKR